MTKETCFLISLIPTFYTINKMPNKYTKYPKCITIYLSYNRKETRHTYLYAISAHNIYTWSQRPPIPLDAQ